MKGKLDDAPLPPDELMGRVGQVEQLPEEVLAHYPDWRGDPRRSYDELGAIIRGHITDRLPAEWSFEGKTVLDFGCGAGRVLRHFLPEAETAEFWGSDIDAPSIAWLEQNLSPPLHVLTNGADPPIELESGKFDLIYAISVFTHLTDNWAEWLLEMRRLLKPDGLLLASFLGSGVAYSFERSPCHEPWDEDQIGMHVTGRGTGWREGGPSTHHSVWWLRAHWGRAFETLRIEPGDNGHSHFLGRPLPGEITSEDLHRPEPDEPREAAALAYSLRNAEAEAEWLRSEWQGALEEENRRLRADNQALLGSRSWRLTSPLRRLAAWKRSRQGSKARS